MTLEIKLDVKKTRLAIQGDAEATLTLRNAGAQPVRVAEPERSMYFPILRLASRTTGETTAFRKPLPPEVLEDDPTVALEPGKELTWTFELGDLLRFPRPGEFDLTAEYEWDAGAGLARSAPVALEITPLFVRELFLGQPHNPVGQTFFLWWTQTIDDARKLMRSRIVNYDFKPAYLTAMTEIGELPSGALPLASIAANPAHQWATWLTWVREGRLHHQFVDEAGVAGKPRSTELPDAQLKIAPYPLIREDRRAELLLWLGSREADTAKLQLATIGEKDQSAAAGAELTLSSRRPPAWMQTTLLSNQRRLALLAYQQDEAVQLRLTHWEADGELSELNSLLTAPGRFVAAGLSVLEEDGLSGLLVTRADDQPDELNLIQWRRTANGEFEQDPPETVAFDGGVDDFAIRINRYDKPCVALKSAAGWQFRGPGEAFAPLGGHGATHQGPLGLFFDDASRPLLIFPFSNMGLILRTPNGDEPTATSTL